MDMKNTRGIFFFLSVWVFGWSLSAQTVQLSDLTIAGPDAGIQKYYELEVDMDAVRAQLKDAPSLGSELPGRQIQLPTADGQWHTFELWEAAIMMEGLAKRFPMIKNLKGRAIDNPRLGIRLNYGPRGLFAVMHDDKDKSYIQTPGLYAEKHRLYFSKHTRSNWTCDVDDTNLAPDGEPAHSSKSNNCTVLGDQLFTYRIVVATTGEFWNLNGGNLTDVLNALNNRLADMLIPYERDLSMTFQLVDSNYIVMYNDPSTDPFPDPTNTVVSLDDAQFDIEAHFDPAHYDIGHGYHEIICGGGCGFGGLAGVAVGCRDGSKARGYTFQPNDIVDNTVFSHEFGHQLGCRHCNYGCNSSGCHRVEPGQGVTIMSTSANCSNADDYGDRVDYFHARSIDAILEYTENGLFNFLGSNCSQGTISGWSKCVSESPTNNGIPTSDANPNALNLTIPKSTPFFLEGAASDPDSDPWTANWVDYNSDPDNSVIPDNAGTSTTAPLFRWFQPDGEVIRYFPQLSSILNGNNTTGTGEVLPSVGRTMDFRFIVRDNSIVSTSGTGALACDELTVTVDGNSGPFEVTSQNAGATWQSGDTETITWSVNNTNQAPISASDVDILFSSDGGQNFSVTLASGVPNDGTHDITVPTVNTMEGRIKVRPAGDYIFFDINNVDINVSDDCLADGQQIFPSTLLQAEEGDPALMLDMDYGAIVSSISDVINSGDPNYDLATEGQTMGTCESFPQLIAPNYKTYDFKVTSSGSYSFSRTSGNIPVINLYSPNFINTSVCDNWLASNTINTSGFSFSLSNSVASSFTAHNENELTFNDFDGNGVSYTISISGPGDVYFPGSPLAGFNYEYVVVEDLTGNIDLISPSPDLTSFGVGDYTVYGLSYDDGENVQDYVGGAFTTLEMATLNGAICANLSSNSRDIEIQQLMPLDFLSFEATLVKGGAQLDWRIADPINVSHFQVDRWGPEDSDFEYLATVDFLDGQVTYGQLDPNIQEGSDYLYRIRSVDFDGFTLFSPVRRVRTPAEGLFTVFPNPSRQFFNLDGPVQQIQQLRVTNALGQSVLDTREPQSRISAKNWTPGPYELQITTPDQLQRIRLIVQ